MAFLILSCVQRLEESMAGIKGVRKIHKNRDNHSITEMMTLVENLLDLLVFLNLKSARYVMDDDVLFILDYAIRSKRLNEKKKN